MPITLPARIHTLLFISLFLLAGLPAVSSPVALLAGFAFSLTLGNPGPEQTAKASKILLKAAVIGLGFGINLGDVLAVGSRSLLLTLLSITATLALGEGLGRAMKLPANTYRLLAFGTAICGGSAIAAMAPVLKAKDEEIALSLATVFTLNAVALVLFPPLGHLFRLDQQQFGLWAALAIHDTSSVVGASVAYGALALAVGTTVKLTRALWIAPCTIVAGLLLKTGKRPEVPLFIIGFILAAAINTGLPSLNPAWAGLYSLAKRVLVMTLFLIGAGLTRSLLQRVGFKPLLLGGGLWLVVSTCSLILILQNMIGP